MKPVGYIVINPWEPVDKEIGTLGPKLCKDHKFRRTAWLGTFSECLKIYKQRGAAINAARKFGIAGHTYVFALHEGDSINGTGLIFARIPDAKDDEPEFRRLTEEDIQERRIETSY